MKSVDTNLVVRFLTRDEPEQAAGVRECFNQGVFISTTVLMETEWVLRSGYGWDRERIGIALLNLIHIDQVDVSELVALEWAIDRYRAKADWADLLHLIMSRGHDAFVTFDKALAKQAGPDAPLPVELLK